MPIITIAHYAFQLISSILNIPLLTSLNLIFLKDQNLLTAL